MVSKKNFEIPFEVTFRFMHISKADGNSKEIAYNSKHVSPSHICNGMGQKKSSWSNL